MNPTLTKKTTSCTITPAHSLLYQTLQKELDNLGSALRCSICQSTLNDPVLLPCVHVYCQDCIHEWLVEKKCCPTCKQPATKRSLVPAESLSSLCHAYKQLLRALGFAPLEYSSSLEGLMTQIQPEYDDDDDSDPEEADQKDESSLHFAIANTWNQVVQAQGDSANRILRQERALVVEAASRKKQQHVNHQDAMDDKGDDRKPAAKKGDDEPVAAAPVNNNTNTTQLSQILQDSRDRETADRSGEWMLEEERRRKLEETKNLSSQGSDDHQAAAKDQGEEALLSDYESAVEEDATAAVSGSQVLGKVDQFLGETGVATKTTGTAAFAAPSHSKPEDDDMMSETTTMDSPPEGQTTSQPPADITTIVANQQLLQVEESAQSAAGDPAATTDGVMEEETWAGEDVEMKDSGAMKEAEIDGRGAMEAADDATPSADAAPMEETPSEEAVEATLSTEEDIGVPDAATSANAPPNSPGVATTSPDEEDFFTAGESTEDTTTTGAYADARSQQLSSTQQASQARPLEVGTIVTVQSRTWPGMNKLGGVARITRVHEEGSSLSYDVTYVLGGKEKGVEAIFVSVDEKMEESVGSPGATEDNSESDQRKSRRLRTTPQDQFPEALLEQLASDGFDTAIGVDQVRRSNISDKTPKSSNRKREPLAKSVENVEVRSSSSNLPDKRKKGTGAPKVAPNPKKPRVETNTAAESIDALPTDQVPDLDKEEKCRLADEHYKGRLATAVEKKVISVVSSSLSEYDSDMLEVLSKESKNSEVKIKLTEVFHADKTTMCIMPATSQGAATNLTATRRTVKAMRASLAGIPIVSPAWLYSCQEAKKFVAPTGGMFIRTIPTKTDEMNSQTEFGVSLVAARIEQVQKKLLPRGVNTLPLRNVCVMLCGQFSSVDRSPKRADVQLLVREAGAEILTSAGALFGKLKAIASCSDNVTKVILLCDESTKDDRCGISSKTSGRVKTVLKNYPDRVLVVNSGWLFDSVAAGLTAPALYYEPRSPLARELWNLCKFDGPSGHNRSILNAELPKISELLETKEKVAFLEEATLDDSPGAFSFALPPDTRTAELELSLEASLGDKLYDQFYPTCIHYRRIVEVSTEGNVWLGAATSFADPATCPP